MCRYTITLDCGRLKQSAHKRRYRYFTSQTNTFNSKNSKLQPERLPIDKLGLWTKTEFITLSVLSKLLPYEMKHAFSVQKESQLGNTGTI